ncbi:beta/gamma crystallin-related protein [Brevundimonas sp. PAMC22021]|uniref:beta/gamma crystallin-related protein n=1 Tax=Brevundimonas sp. PAMC22021 TaxID=2861285 RepID=UPI001C633FF7|nr:beta/gamma crystallin-related protein [Brevundimonas sp. PAMC22021]QYF87602.1 hypothetical protein KY493_03620 [Brevundimonas sp. PAMC22021]
MAILLSAAMAAGMLMPVQARGDMSVQRVAPRGSYTESCTEAFVNRGRLYADCRDLRGRMRGTSIEVGQCGGEEIHNDNGRLVCGRIRGDYEDGEGGGRPGRPGGGGWGDNDGRPGGGSGGGWNGGRQTLTLYADPDYRGLSERFRGEAPDLRRSPLNRQASAIRAEGQWQVCSEPGYRGRCRVVEGDLRTLFRLGMDDSIASLRPWRGDR